MLLLASAAIAYTQGLEKSANIKGTKISVSYNQSLFPKCETSTEAKNTDKDMEGQMPWAIAPEHFLFKFIIDPLEKYPRTNELRLIPINGLNSPEFKSLYSDLYSTVEKLSPLLVKRPVSFPLGSTIPEWNLTDSDQTIHAKVKYLDFPLHQGIFFISQETQESDGNPVNSNETYCSYQGLSRDGNWYIDLYLKIGNPSLPIDADAADSIVRDPERKYLLFAESFLNKINPDSFTPKISQIEKLIGSIHFK